MTKPAPPKPTYGAPCNGCGACCRAVPCRMARDLVVAFDAPCPGDYTFDKPVANASIIAEMAGKQGVVVEKQSASSLLSRLKNQGVVTYDGRHYRLNRATPPQEDAPMRH